jgi:branched-chain amino acid transport system permease protein
MDFLNAIVALMNFVIIPATAYGAQLALGALGVTLIYGILRFSNFAHGDTMAFGAMVTILFTWGLSVGRVAGPAAHGAAGAAPRHRRDRASGAGYRPRGLQASTARKRPSRSSSSSPRIGVMFIINGIVRFIIGVDDQRFSDGERFIISARTFREMTGLDEGLAFRTTQGLTIVVAIIAVALLFWFLNRTRTGKAMRAFSDNEDLALLSGINPERVVVITWLIVAALATTAGVLYGLDKSFKPFTYFQLLLPIFAVAIVGGLGNPLGAILGGFLIAFSEVGVTYAFRKVVAYLAPGEWQPDGLLQLLSTDYKFAVSFGILLIVLLFRPTGIMKGKSI